MSQNEASDYYSASVLKRIITRIEAAGSKSEDDSKVDGFMSYHAEAHSAGMGIAAGYTATAHGEAKLLGLVYAAAVHGEAHARNGKRRRIFRDIAQEPHYALGGIVTGAILGTFTGFLSNIPGIDAPTIADLGAVLLNVQMAVLQAL